MTVQKEKLIYGLNLGFKLGRLEFIWTGPWGKENLEPCLKEIRALLQVDRVNVKEEDFATFYEGILTFYMRRELELFYHILIGHVFFLCMMSQGTTEEKYEREVLDMAAAVLKDVPESYIGERKMFLAFCKKHRTLGVAEFLPVLIRKLEEVNTKEKLQKAGPYIFISYSNTNFDIACAMRKLLCEKNFPVWMAPYDIPAGAKYAHILEETVMRCSCVLLLLSDASQNSQHVEREVERAVSYKKTIITMQLEDLVLNPGFRYYLSTSQMVQVPQIDESSEEMRKILAALALCVHTNEPSRYRGIPLKQQVSMMFTALSKTDFQKARWDCETKEISVPEDGIFQCLCTMAEETGEDFSLLWELQTRQLCWKVLYHIAKEGEFSDLCKKMSKISREEYEVMSKIAQKGQNEAARAMNAEMVHLCFLDDDDYDPENYDFWQTFLTEYMVFTMLCDTTEPQ